ncbi:MAG: BNR repeat-containing protein [Bryobacterales bacterium]|nr:BNR repeat-containing protein [Bryobacterales bacterium]
MRLSILLLLAAMPGLSAERPAEDGYRGIWYYNQPSNDKYVYKYSGGFATYPQQHTPIAIYSKEANKTFFCYGGTAKGTHNRLLHMVSYFDHTTGEVPRPVLLLDKKTDDAHDNPTISIDGEGYIWIFSSAHGTSRPSYIHKSAKPYSIVDFELIQETNFSYPQPWYVPGRGFLFLHTRYQKAEKGRSPGRALYWMVSPDGREWNSPQQLAFALQGHYQVSWSGGERVGTAFNIHPPPLGLNQRTNLYYLETRDLGDTWITAGGEIVDIPVTTEQNPALVRDYRSQGLLVYLKDVQYDSKGRPVILYMTSKGYESGPENGPRMFRTARWTGKNWDFQPVAASDHNYDYGSIYLESDGTWRLIAPTGAGPQPHGTGGEIEMWTSSDEGKSWKMVKKLTQDSRYNHTYVRRPLHAHPDFYAIWADGNALAPSDSSLYFADRNGGVWQLPAQMEGAFAKPQKVRGQE